MQKVLWDPLEISHLQFATHLLWHLCIYNLLAGIFPSSHKIAEVKNLISVIFLDLLLLNSQPWARF